MLVLTDSADAYTAAFRQLQRISPEGISGIRGLPDFGLVPEIRHGRWLCSND